MRAALGYDRQYGDGEMMREFLRENYYRGDMEADAIVAHIEREIPELRAMSRYLEGEELDSIVGAAMYW